MMNVLNAVLSKIFEIIFIPFQNINPWYGMIVISLLTGILMLYVFKLTSDQEGIKKAKNKIKAHLLEMRLYKNDLITSFKAQGNILVSNFKYMRHSVKPLLVMIIPILLIIIHSNFWFAYDPLDINEKALLKIKLSEEYTPSNFDIKIIGNDFINIETPPVRIDDEHEIAWRFSALKQGVHEIEIQAGEKSLTKSVSIGQRPLSKISPLKKRKSIMNELLYPVEKPLDKNSPVKSIEISYPTSGLRIFGMNIHWIISFFILSIIFGFSLKGLFGVEI